MTREEMLQEEKARQDDAGRLINIVSHQLKRTMTLSTEKDCGLTNMQHRILSFVLFRITEGSVYQKDIEKEFHIRKSTATEILQLMERNGFLYRECSKEDARMKRIIPTEKAVKAQEQVVAHIRAVENKLRAGIDKEDFMTCLAVLRKMSENLTNNESNLCERGENNE